MMRRYWEIFRVVTAGIFFSLACSMASCASWNLNKDEEPVVPQSSLSPEESSQRIDKILEEREEREETEEGDGEEATGEGSLDSTSLCLQEVMRGLLQCHIILLDTIDAGDLESMPDCSAFFQRGIEHIAADADAGVAGLAASMVEFRAVESAAVEHLGGSSRPLACMASAVLWRSIFRGQSKEAARGVPAAMKIIEGTSPDHANALFGLPLWSRAALLSQAPAEFGGNLEQAAKDLDASMSMAGPLLPYIHALRGRYLCTARQDSQCLERAEQAFRSTPANPEVYHAANRLVQWVRARYNLLFPTGPLVKDPAPPLGNDSSEASSG